MIVLFTIPHSLQIYNFFCSNLLSIKTKKIWVKEGWMMLFVTIWKLTTSSDPPWLSQENLLSVYWSGFQSSDSSVNQLLSNAYNLDKVFYAYPTLETCGVFIGVSKAFEKAWHKGLIFKLNSVGVSDLC